MIEDIYNWLTVAGVPQVGTPQQFNLWLKLMLEEAKEMKKGYLENNREEMLDAYVDLLWVNTNLPFMFGFTLEEIQSKLEAVSKSNWSKFCDNEDDTMKSIRMYHAGTHPTKLGESIEAYYEIINDNLFVIKRAEDDKILKSFKYEKP